MSELTPITRIESYLDAIVNNGIPPTEDITRIETFLQAIYDNQVCALTPITRIEMFLGKISGQDIVLPEPITRIELYLAAIAGEDVELPEEPITRIEMYLAEWADSGDWTTISGAIVEFITQRAHKLKSCVVNMEPKQDLNGYDSPWPAGGGKNILDDAYSASYTNELTLTEGTYYAQAWLLQNPSQHTTNPQVLIDGTWTGCAPPYSGDGLSVTGTSFGWLYNNATQTIVVDAGKTFTIRYNRNDAAMQTRRLTFSKTQLSAFSPYENICPISGWTGCEVTRTGKNLCKSVIQGFPNQSTHTIRIDNDTETGVFYAVEGQTYVRSASIASNMAIIAHVNTDNVVNGTPYTEIATSDPTTWTATWTGWTVWYYYATKNTDIEASLQIELGSTATDYEEYNGNSYSVTFGETVYGATPDIVSGEMPIDTGLFILDGSPDEYMAGSGNRITNTALRGLIATPTSASSVVSGNVANWLPQATANQTYVGRLGFSIGPNGDLEISDGSGAMTVSGLRTMLSENPLVLALKIATPTQTTITPQQITALKGYNAMWSDAGDIEVTAHGTPVEVPTLQALNMLLGGAYRNNQTADDVSDDEALDIILGGDNK